MQKMFKVSLVLLCVVGFALAQGTQRAVVQEKPAEQVFKNIQILKGLPASQLRPTMDFISASLGVRCDYCHTRPFDKDDKETKQAARRMMQMTADINQRNFGGAQVVTCYTCHKSQPVPASIPQVGHFSSTPSPEVKSTAPLPSIEQVLGSHVQALGGQAALTKVTTRVIRATRAGADGKAVAEEIYQKAPARLLVVTGAGQQASRTGFNGQSAWGQDARGVSPLTGQERSEFEQEANFYRDLKLKDLYTEMSVRGREMVAEREAYVVEAKTSDGQRERLYFDAQTGLLVRRYRMLRTAFGLYPSQIDYEDYREVEGIRLPFTVRWSVPGRVSVRKITEVKQNTPVDDALFNPPPQPAPSPQK